jgi:hypothetical protein
MYRVIEDYYRRSGMGTMPVQSGIWIQSDFERKHFDDFEKSLGKEWVSSYLHFYFFSISNLLIKEMALLYAP